VKKKLIFILLAIIIVSCAKDEQCKYLVQVSYQDNSIDTLSFTAITNNNKLSLSNGVFKVGNKMYIKDSVIEYKLLYKECATVTDSIIFIK
jgi:hypothetical protein